MASASSDFVLAGTGDDRQAERTVLQRRDRQAHGRQAGVACDRPQGESGVIEAAGGFVAQEAQRRDRRRRGQHEKRSRWQQLPQANCRLGAPGIPSRADGRIERTHAVETRLDGRTEDRIAAQEVAVLADDVETLQRHVRLEEVGRPAGEDLHFFESTHRPCRILQDSRRLGLGQRKGVGSQQQPGRRWRRRRRSEQALCTKLQMGGVAGEQADRVVARREADDAVQRDAAMAGTPAEQAAEARGNAHRAAGVGAQAKIGEARRDGDGGTARRAAGQAIGRARICRRAVMFVLAFQAEGQFVGDRLADQGRAGAQQAIDGRRRLRRRLLPAGPMRVAAAGHVSGDVQKVLGDEGEAIERARSQRRQACPGTGNEGAVVVHFSALRIVSVGAVQPTMPPWARIMASVAALNSGK